MPKLNANNFTNRRGDVFQEVFTVTTITITIVFSLLLNYDDDDDDDDYHDDVTRFYPGCPRPD